MAHIFTLVGCLFVPLLYGMTAVILRSLHPRRIFDTIAGQRVQYVTAVPEILELLTRLWPRAGTAHHLRAFVSGGSRLPASAYHRIRECFGVELLHGYGLTEFAPVARNIRGASQAGTVGPLCAGVDLRVEGHGPEGTGEMMIRSPEMFRGYLGRPEQSKAAWNGEWFRTGDFGTLQGTHVVFHSEKKATCKINGAMVDLAEVRRAVVSLPLVQDAEVEYRDGCLSATVDAAPWGRPEILEARRSLGALIASYKIPRQIATR
jgi:long-chain acyl-CoA synthetase